MQMNSNFRISLIASSSNTLGSLKCTWFAERGRQRIQQFGKRKQKGIYAKFAIQSSDAHILHSFQIT